MLTCNDVACSYSGHLIFEGVNISLDKGALVVLHGPNGAGKTSFLKILAGIKVPKEGEVLWDGQHIADAVDEGNLQMQYLGHNYAVKSEMTVYENLSFWAELNGDPEKIPEALTLFGLGEYAETMCSQLSDGWKKRVTLAKLICCYGDMWILDEPYNNLDVSISEKLDNIISEKAKAGGIIVLSSHTLIPIEFAEKLNIANYAPKAA